MGRILPILIGTLIGLVLIGMIASNTPVPTPLPGWAPGNVAQEAGQSLLFSFQRTVDAAIWGIIFIPLVLLYLVPILMVVWLIRRGWKRYRVPH